MRDRLVELLIEVDNMRLMRKSFKECVDYLLDNGVIVPKIKVDDIVYRCGEENVHEYQIVRLDVYPDEIVYIDDSDNEIFENDIGVSVFLTLESALAKLKEGGEG